MNLYRAFQTAPCLLPIGYGTPGDFESILKQAVDVPGKAAVSLSGGVDSSLVASLRPDALAITAYYDDADERSYAWAVVGALGMSWEQLHISEEEWWEALPHALDALGTPMCGPGCVGQYLIARRAAELDIDVVFTGSGGDEFFDGYVADMVWREFCNTSESLVERFPHYSGAVSDVLHGGRKELYLWLTIRDREVYEEVLPWFLERFTSPRQFRTEYLLPSLVFMERSMLSAFGISRIAPLLHPDAVATARDLPWEIRKDKRLLRDLARMRGIPAAVTERRDKMGFPVPWMRDRREWARICLEHFGKEQSGMSRFLSELSEIDGVTVGRY